MIRPLLLVSMGTRQPELPAALVHPHHLRPAMALSFLQILTCGWPCHWLLICGQTRRMVGVRGLRKHVVMCREMVMGQPSPLLSSFKLSYYTLLNLMRRAEGSGQDMEYVIKRSFQQYQFESSLPQVPSLILSRLLQAWSPCGI